MSVFIKKIQIADTICDCIPVVSTITNGVMYLYDLVYKVDAAANPAKPGWKTDLKIYVLDKTAKNRVSHPAVPSSISMIGKLVPVLSNIVFIARAMIRKGKDVDLDYLKNAIERGDDRAVALCLKSPIATERRVELLEVAAAKPSATVFKMILSSFTWKAGDLIKTLKNATLSGRLTQDHATEIFNTFEVNHLKIDSEEIFQMAIDALKNSLTNDHQSQVRKIREILADAPVSYLLNSITKEKSGEDLDFLLDDFTQISKDDLIAYLEKIESCSPHQISIIIKLLDKSFLDLREIVECLFPILIKRDIHVYQGVLDHYKNNLTFSLKQKVISQLSQILKISEFDQVFRKLHAEWGELDLFIEALPEMPAVYIFSFHNEHRDLTDAQIKCLVKKCKVISKEDIHKYLKNILDNSLDRSINFLFELIEQSKLPVDDVFDFILSETLVSYPLIFDAFIKIYEGKLSLENKIELLKKSSSGMYLLVENKIFKKKHNMFNHLMERWEADIASVADDLLNHILSQEQKYNNRGDAIDDLEFKKMAEQVRSRFPKANRT